MDTGKKFAPIVCYCGHDCCDVDPEIDYMVIYDCEKCTCHEDLRAWDDVTWD